MKWIFNYETTYKRLWIHATSIESFQEMCPYNINMISTKTRYDRSNLYSDSFLCFLLVCVFFLSAAGYRFSIDTQQGQYIINRRKWINERFLICEKNFALWDGWEINKRVDNDDTRGQVYIYSIWTNQRY